MLTKCEHSIFQETCKHCKSLQDSWYKKLKGFKDIEDKSLQLLKKWTGISDTYEDHDDKIINIIDYIQWQAPNTEIESSWPEARFSKEAELLNHPDLKGICESIFKHGNNAISSHTMVRVWRYHCEGFSLREIEKKVNVNFVTLFRSIKRLEEYMSIMDLEPIESVVVREYVPITDDPFVFASWRNSLWFDSHTDSAIDPVFYRRKTKEIRLFLQLPGVETRIACLKRDPDQIVGYATLNDKTIQFTYVKLDYRNQGVAKLLTKGFLDIAEPCTKIGKSIAKNHDLKVKKNEEKNGTKEDNGLQVREISSGSSTR